MKKFLILSLVLFLFSLPAWAAEEQSVELTEMILQVKNQLNLDVNNWEFDSEYIHNKSEENYWRLEWHNDDYSQWLTVNIQPETRSILNAYYNNSKMDYALYSGYPAYNEEACLKIANQWLRENWPQAAAQVALKTVDSQDPIVPTQRSYPYQYSFYFYRVKDGYPVAHNGIDISVNGETGEICRWTYEWNDHLVLPSAKNIISLEQAKSIFQDQAAFNLNYKMIRRYDPKSGQNLILTYVPQNRDIFINALTGEIMDSSQLSVDGNLINSGYGAVPTAELEAAKAANDLSPSELDKVDELKQVISKEKAAQIANEFQAIPEGFQLTRASLLPRPDLIGVKAYWSLYYEDESKKYDLSYDISSNTGEVLNFYRNTPLSSNKGEQLTQKQAQQAAENLIKKYNSERFAQLSLTDSRYTEASQYTYPSYSFSYKRQVNGIDYPENSYYISIMADTGEVISYIAQWDNAQFPNPVNLMQVSQIKEQFLQDKPFQILYTKDNDNHCYLVYYTSTGFEDIVYDAKTGELLDSSGNPVEKAQEEIAFNDIAGHPAEDDILSLAKAGIISTTDPYYRPDDPMSVAEWIVMLVKTSLNIYVDPKVADNEPWYANYWKAAQQRGILNDQLQPDPNSQLSRMAAAQTLINALGYQKVAELDGIYNLHFQDLSNIQTELQGYTAIINGLGLIPAKNEFFLPYDYITRGEAAQILMRKLML